MKSFFLSLGLCTLLAAPAFGQYTAMPVYDQYILKAEGFYNDNKFGAAAHAYSSGFERVGWNAPVKDKYNAARSWALSNTPDSAFFYLQNIAELQRFNDIDRISKDQDFNSLHQDKRWKPLLKQVKKNKKRHHRNR